MLPRAELLDGSRNPAGLETLITAAEHALRTWEPIWTGFLDGALLEEGEERLGGLADLEVHADGGYPGAERCRLLIVRQDSGLIPTEIDPELTGLDISGNFLFDPCRPDDFRTALEASGLPRASMGDLWTRGDRGAQAIIATQATEGLTGSRGLVRGVDVRLEVVPRERLQLPLHRQPRRFHTVEASLRLDAVASAGFGLSRGRMADLIRAGEVRVNWDPVTSPSRDLSTGDRIQLTGRGELMIEAANLTKRERWRLDLIRT